MNDHASDAGGEFVRRDTTFRNWVTADGSPGPSGRGGFAAEPGRYRLYVSLACPWAHRTLILRKLKGLEDAVPVSVVHPLMPPESWKFGDYPGATPDPEIGAEYLHELYELAQPGFDGVVTVPVLWDREQRVIVNNESAEIIRMFNSAFGEFASSDADYYPLALRDEIDALNGVVYDNVNNGVYRCGFAASQQAYDRAFERLFATLDDLESRLARNRYLVGGQITEADWRLFPTLARFDAVYHGHFKCNRRRLVDYPNLWGYARELYQAPGIAGTVDLDHIKTHYYGSHRSLNPSGIVPRGPEIDFTTPHGRAAIG